MQLLLNLVHPILRRAERPTLPEVRVRGAQHGCKRFERFQADRGLSLPPPALLPQSIQIRNVELAHLTVDSLHEHGLCESELLARGHAVQTLSLTDGGVEAFREMLAMYDLPRSPASQRQIGGIANVTIVEALR